jgi:hypothetical protein
MPSNITWPDCPCLGWRTNEGLGHLQLPWSGGAGSLRPLTAPTAGFRTFSAPPRPASVGTSKGAKSVLHHWLHAKEKIATAAPPRAEVQFQPAVRPLPRRNSRHFRVFDIPCPQRTRNPAGNRGWQAGQWSGRSYSWRAWRECLCGPGFLPERACPGEGEHPFGNWSRASLSSKFEEMGPAGRGAIPNIEGVRTFSMAARHAANRALRTLK